MNDKEFVLVSQGIEIYRTKSQENAVNMVKEYNDEYFDYLQKCYDNYERTADNYVDLEIEYSNEKEKDKEIERLNKQIEEYQKALDETTSKKIDLESIIKEVREKLKELVEDDGTFIGEIDYLRKKELLEILDKDSDKE